MAQTKRWSNRGYFFDNSIKPTASDKTKAEAKPAEGKQSRAPHADGDKVANWSRITDIKIGCSGKYVDELCDWRTVGGGLEWDEQTKRDNTLPYIYRKQNVDARTIAFILMKRRYGMKPQCREAWPLADIWINCWSGSFCCSCCSLSLSVLLCMYMNVCVCASFF